MASTAYSNSNLTMMNSYTASLFVGLGVRRWNSRRLHILSTSTRTTTAGGGGGGGSNQKLTRRLFVPAATQGSSGESDKNIPSWARPDSDEPPPWARNDDDKVSSPLNRNNNLELPFYVYLLASAIIAIAAIGSAFEYVNQRPVFGILNSDSIFYAPLLGFFAFTGIPTSAFLWFKSVQVANKEAEEQDKRDGYR